MRRRWTYSEKKPFHVSFGGFLLRNASAPAKSATFFSISSAADFALTPGAIAMRQSNRHQEGTELAQSPPFTIATFKSIKMDVSPFPPWIVDVVCGMG